MNIWLDDQRKAPEGWIHLHNIDELKLLMQTIHELKDFYIETMSFDFHLSHPKNGVDVMKYLINQCNQDNSRRFWPKTVLYHSNDPEGVRIMEVFATQISKTFLKSS